MDKITDNIKYPIAFFIAAMIVIYLVIFEMPNHINQFALIPEKLASGEYWRLLTFQFSHLNNSHLLENIAGAGLAAGIATHLKMNSKTFSSTYLSTGMFAVVPIFAAAPFVALGASGAVYGALGAVSMEAKKFGINPLIMLGILAATIFAQAALTGGNIGAPQGLVHFSGLAMGAILPKYVESALQKLTKKRSYVLRGVKSIWN